MKISTEKALLIVDVQIDFCPGGALGVDAGHEIVDRINAIMGKFDLIIASGDMHPTETVHFEKWPVHCVRGTEGSKFHPDLKTENINIVLEKGTSDKDDGYSVFEATNKNLDELLKARNIKKLYIAGLATDYCVKETVIDAIKRGYEVYVFTDCIKAVNINPGDGEKALNLIEKMGAKLIETGQVF